MGRLHNYSDPKGPRYALCDSLPPRNILPEKLKIVSWNICYSKHISKAIELFHQSPELHDADVLCLQEMLPEAVKKIASKLHYNYVYYPACYLLKIKNDFGNAVLSKWPIMADHKLILPKITNEHMQRIAVAATLDIAGKKVLVLSVHARMFIHSWKWHIPLSVLENHISSSPYSIIAGDFNTLTNRSNRALAKLLEAGNFQWIHDSSCWSYRHWYLFNKKSYLDHIFARGFKAQKVGHILNFKPSDHLPIWAQLNWLHQ